MTYINSIHGIEVMIDMGNCLESDAVIDPDEEEKRVQRGKNCYMLVVNMVHERQRSRTLAFAMATHPRLGAESSLGQDMIRLICRISPHYLNSDLCEYV